MGGTRKKRRRKRWETTSVVVRDLVRRYELTDRVHELQVCSMWPEIVGAAAARRSAAVQFAGGTLHVLVESPTWLTELRMMKEDILANVRKQARVPVRRVKFVVGVLPPKPAPKPQGVESKAELSPEDRAEVLERSQAVRDPELRAVVLRALEAHTKAEKKL